MHKWCISKAQVNKIRLDMVYNLNAILLTVTNPHQISFV